MQCFLSAPSRFDSHVVFFPLPLPLPALLLLLFLVLLLLLLKRFLGHVQFMLRTKHQQYSAFFWGTAPKKAPAMWSFNPNNLMCAVFQNVRSDLHLGVRRGDFGPQPHHLQGAQCIIRN